jgi:hypothetical protein
MKGELRSIRAQIIVLITRNGRRHGWIMIVRVRMDGCDREVRKGRRRRMWLKHFSEESNRFDFFITRHKPAGKRNNFCLYIENCTLIARQREVGVTYFHRRK